MYIYIHLCLCLYMYVYINRSINRYIDFSRSPFLSLSPSLYTYIYTQPLLLLVSAIARKIVDKQQCMRQITQTECRVCCRQLFMHYARLCVFLVMNASCLLRGRGAGAMYPGRHHCKEGAKDIIRERGAGGGGYSSSIKSGSSVLFRHCHS